MLTLAVVTANGGFQEKTSRRRTNESGTKTTMDGHDRRASLLAIQFLGEDGVDEAVKAFGQLQG